MTENLDVESFTNKELSDLHNALNIALVYSQEHLLTWIGIAEENPSAATCVKMTESEISSYSELIKKIESIRGF